MKFSKKLQDFSSKFPIHFLQSEDRSSAWNFILVKLLFLGILFPQSLKRVAVAKRETVYRNNEVAIKVIMTLHNYQPFNGHVLFHWQLLSKALPWSPNSTPCVQSATSYKLDLVDRETLQCRKTRCLSFDEKLSCE